MPWPWNLHFFPTKTAYRFSLLCQSKLSVVAFQLFSWEPPLDQSTKYTSWMELLDVRHKKLPHVPNQLASRLEKINYQLWRVVGINTNQNSFRKPWYCQEKMPWRSLAKSKKRTDLYSLFPTTEECDGNLDPNFQSKEKAKIWEKGLGLKSATLPNVKPAPTQKTQQPTHVISQKSSFQSRKSWAASQKIQYIP